MRAPGLGALAAALAALAATAPAWAARPYIPSPVPINIKPSSLDETLFGGGFNRTTVVLDWRDNFFDRRVGGGGQWEDVGRTQTTAYNLAAGWIRNVSRRRTREWDLLAGKLEHRSLTGRYRSPFLGKDVNVGASGSGFNLGARYLGGFSLARGGLPGGGEVDWNLAFSGHAAGYYMRAKTTAESADGLDINHEDLLDYGILLRPALAFQPIFQIGAGVSLIPYAGVGAMVLAGAEDWRDTKLVRGGIARALGDDTLLTADASLETMAGFDVGFASPLSRSHRCTLGGVAAQFFGGSGGRFTEAHFLYAVPWGRR